MVVATQCGGLTAFLQLHSSFLTREYPKSISPSYRCGLRYANESWFRSRNTLLPDMKTTNSRCLLRVPYSTANDPQNGSQMILDRKWLPTWTANDLVKNWGMEWTLVGWGCLQRNFGGKKGTFPFRLLKIREGGGQITDSFINWINLKRIWYQPYVFLSQLLQISL